MKNIIKALMFFISIMLLFTACSNRYKADPIISSLFESSLIVFLTQL